MTAYASFCQTISIPSNQAKEITKGLINEQKLKKENKILKLEIVNFKEIIIRKDSIITDLQLINKQTEAQKFLVKEQLRLTNEKLKLQSSNTGLKSTLYGIGGVAVGVIAGVLISN